MTHWRLCLSLKRGVDNRDTCTGKGEGGGRESGAPAGTLCRSTPLSLESSEQTPHPPQLAQARGQQENELLVPAGCGAKCEGGEWGLSKCRVWLELESQDGSLGMPGSHWSVALCEWDGRLMVGVPLGPGHPRLEGWDPEKAWRCQQGLP